MQRSFNLMSATAPTMAASITASLTAVVIEAQDFAFNMQKMAAVTGTTTEMMSKLAYSAKLVGTPLESLQGAMEKVARTAGAAQSGQKESISAYAALGISVKDLNGPLKDSGVLTVAVAKKLEQYG